MSDGPIGIFDSGVGGLKVMTAIKRLLPGEDVTYVFDRKHAPYGGRRDGYIKRRAERVSSLLLLRGAKLIVVACNTATAVAIDELRKKFSVPIVGVEPPIKPAVEAAAEGKVLLLCTAATARQRRIAELIEREGKGKIVLAPAPTLAPLIERNFSELSVIKGELDAVLSAYDREKIGAVALGCTHYYHVKELIERHYDGNVPVFSGETGTAERVKYELLKNGLLSENSVGKIKYIYI